LNRRALGALIVGLSLSASAIGAQAGDQLTIVGSSTVYPFATLVAERVHQSAGIDSPVVEATGTGGGFKLFCAGLGSGTPDMTGASRPIKPSEVETCTANGVSAITEIPIGYDGIVLAHSKAGLDAALSRKQIFLALAKTIPINGTMAPNPFVKWRDIDPALPDEKIEVLGPPPTSGTRDAFVELVMDKGCNEVPEIAALEGDAKKQACATIREDGAYIDAGENDNLIVQKLIANPRAFGVFGYSFLEENADTLMGAAIEGVAPSYEAIATGAYPISRELYIYVKNAHRSIQPAIEGYVRELLSPLAMGADGYLAQRGLVPFPETRRADIEAKTLAALEITSLTGAGPATLAGLADATQSSGTIATFAVVAAMGLAVLGFFLGRHRAEASVRGELKRLHSLPRYHGAYVALHCALPALAALLFCVIAQPYVIDRVALGAMPEERLAGLDDNQKSLVLGEIRRAAEAPSGATAADPAIRAAAQEVEHWRSMSNALTAGLALSLAILAGALAYRRIAPEARSRNKVEGIVLSLLFISSTIAILTTVGIVLSLLFETFRFFTAISPLDFLFGLQWSPQMAMRADQVGSSGAFGAIPVIAGTLLITAIAMAVAAPTGLMVAVYLSDYAGTKARAVFKPLVEILAGIPTVVYGFFAALTIGPLLRSLVESIGLDVASESALAAGLVMGVMIIPFVSSLSDDVMNAVPQTLRDGAYALGATKSETIRQVVFPAALPGIIGAMLLAVSRAIGETMIVVMAAGLAANLTANPLQAVTTVTVQVVTLLIGDQEFDSPKTLAAFALGLLLFVVTLCLNIIALHIVRRYREQYD
jgi:phosphate transport system permease protein